MDFNIKHTTATTCCVTMVGEGGQHLEHRDIQHKQMLHTYCLPSSSSENPQDIRLLAISGADGGSRIDTFMCKSLLACSAEDAILHHCCSCLIIRPRCSTECHVRVRVQAFSPACECTGHRTTTHPSGSPPRFSLYNQVNEPHLPLCNLRERGPTLAA